ncbi:MAG: energy-coupling factor transporter ATPase [Corallococcus sp.]|nr:energy-coupling factor transporter ATPase [Corallococcus sp.]MCM1360035.1 energy-coupling factor transporter ATPase [Corallococcus sp.]MCM1395592.1 energy-coupling factor transporter ATPase [Corallococcus sp.]
MAKKHKTKTEQISAETPLSAVQTQAAQPEIGKASAPAWDDNVIVRFDNVSHYYKAYNDDGTVGQAVGVEGVTLELERGSFVALVGHNGCGKSTLAKLTNGLLTPSSGSVKVLGTDTTDKNGIFDIRKNVGMVFQNPDNQMVASIVEEDVAFGPENLGVPQPEIVERVNAALQAVGMQDFAKNSPHKLSGGQKQRIAIAGALAIRPQLLVLDESTAMLDPQGRKEVLEVAHRLNGDGMTVLLITHFMEEVLDCDKVVVMNGGRVVATGAPKEIFANSELLRQVGLQPPRTVRLAQKLNGSGFDVDADESDAKALGGRLCQLLRKI